MQSYSVQSLSGVSMAPKAADTGKLIVVGAGKWGGVLMREFHRKGVLIAITDSSHDAMHAAHAGIGSTSAVSLHETLEDALHTYPNAAVVVATPPSTHYDVALIAINARRDVWVEKPICSAGHEAADLVKMANEKKCILFVDHLLRYHWPHRIVLDLVRSGWVGEVTRVRTIRLNFGTVRTGENVLWSFGPHDVSLVLALCRNKSPSVVNATGQATVTGVEDYVELMLKFDGGVEAHLSTSWLHYDKERRLVVYGKEGCLIVNETPKHETPIIEGYKWSAEPHSDGSAVKILKEKVDIMKAYEELPQPTPVEAALEHFLECCRTRKSPDTDGEEGERVLTVLTAADESLEKNRPIDFSDRGAENGNGRDFKMEDAEVGLPPANVNGLVPKNEVQTINHNYLSEVAPQNPVVMNVQVPQASPLDASTFKTEDKAAVPPQPANVPMDVVSEPRTPAPAASAPPQRDYFVDPSSIVDPGAVIGKGTKIWHFSHVMGGARIGDGCNLGQNIYVGGKAIIGDHVKIQNGVSIFDGVEVADDAFLGPHCTFTNVKTPRSFLNRRSEFAKTTVGQGATIGANATIICGNSLGAYSLVGAGAVVTRDVPDYACVVGNPAKFHSWVSQTGAELVKVADGSSGTQMLECAETKDCYRLYGAGEAAVVKKI